MTDIKNKILETIKKGEVKMRPRWHFVLKAILAIGGAIFVALALLFFTSLITFLIQDSGAWLAPGLGFPGFRLLLGALPWLLVWAAIALIIVLEILVSRYSFAYRQPLLYSILGIVMLAVGGGLLVAQTSLHPGLTEGVRAGRWPLARPLYENFDPGRLPAVHPGTITEMTANGFTVVDHRNQTFSVNITTKTFLPPEFQLTTGIEVVVFGQEADGVVEAVGIRPFGPRLKGEIKP